ncbi:DUF1246 domain-containing protein, partial [Candidatus Woesearchaeota archaeon]|nr:DUF1246 domain-containing protein [Candidatus Woesearchaeota archaeon]
MASIKIATLGSHSALQILKGAKQEGFKTILVCIKDREKTYKMFNVADEIITIDNYRNFMGLEKELIEKNAVIIPHASFIEYVGNDNVKKMKVPYFGNKNILKIEADRDAQRKWVKDAG